MLIIQISWSSGKYEPITYHPIPNWMADINVLNSWLFHRRLEIHDLVKMDICILMERTVYMLFNMLKMELHCDYDYDLVIPLLCVCNKICLKIFIAALFMTVI